ncbi:MAG: ABC transporter ATP-binding protein [Palaeococcus sp.]|uniref:ABC transporter ATP-binding protein n=1 Tax=Palaeococcus sp. (in: euryarchaeotes) TaxID=2820298 RepID=UPI0025E4C52D|nr:ABC transporter ATP-binding protein [Palaeococcus sp. (in: euryarchaeotes)]MCD6559536.1 ABC transporter ATP-binding protein [Palaeococcus sp. (in: euryarchaeotes)]
MEQRIVLKTKGLVKNYYIGRSIVVPALRGVDLRIYEGEFIAIVGPSGSGKTTLLNMLGLLDRPTAGQIYVDGMEVSSLNDNQLSEIRLRKIGFIFQYYNLMPILTALENVEMPMVLAGLPKKERIKRAKELLKAVGLERFIRHKPNEMSGGQQQRVAIARALANNPSIVLADEPTGNLDTKTSEEIIKLLGRINREKGTTLVVVTHDPDIAEKAHRILQIRDGILKEVVA